MNVRREQRVRSASTHDDRADDRPLLTRGHTLTPHSRAQPRDFGLGVEVDVSPTECADLAAPHAGCHNQPHERAPVFVERERRVEQTCGVGG